MPVFPLNTDPAPVPALLPVFASPCDPGADPGSHLPDVLLYTNTSFPDGAVAYSTSPIALKLEPPNLVSTFASV